MSNAISSFGTLLKIGDGGSPENFATIAETLNIKGPKLVMATHDVTSQSSPGGFREYVAGLLEGGDVTLDVNFIPTDATQGYGSGLVHDMVNRTLRNFQLVFPDAGNTTWQFAAYVMDFEPDAPVDGQLKAAVTLRISGQPTFA